MPAIKNAEMGWNDTLFADICQWPYPVDSDQQIILLVMRGDPLPAPRARVTRRGTYMPENYQAYRDSLRWVLKEKFQHCGASLEPSVRFGLKAIFFRKTRHRTDVDNLMKTVCDAGTGTVWKDDSQVVETFGRAFFESDDPRVVILVYTIDELPSELAMRQFTCEKCGTVVTCANGKEAKRRKYCSDECRYPARETLTCLHCGKAYQCAPSLIKYGYVRACSRECAQSVHQSKAASSQQKNRCETCGGKVSRRTYKQCRSCFIKTQPDNTSVYQWVRPVE